ncbi:MAG TPA: retroviral-like aspartic protease family protein [Sphingomicrobium sp.]|nr:retroviral-like aspartic protease family protein [Sphingomicrobium sp.]
MQRTFLIAALTALGAGSLGAQTQTTRVETVSGPADIDKTTQTEEVRFKTDANERMTVPVLLSGRGPYRFLVDTGADRTAISRELASRLNLAAGADASLHSVSGVSTVSTATVPALQLTRKEIRNIHAPLLKSENMGADGILGTDSLRAQRVLFDFAANTLSIVPSAAPDFKSEPGTIVIEGTRRNGRLVVTEAMANGRPLTVVIDTGSEVTIGNAPLRKALLGAKALTGLQPITLESVTGEKIAGDYMFVRQLDIGGVGLKNLAVVFADAHTFRQMKLDKKPALLLGMNAMRAFKKVSIDFTTRKMRVVLPEHSALDRQLASARLR